VAKILVVDDKPSNRRVLVAALKAARHDPFEAENGAAALDLARARQPDLVITDILMPVMDGFEFAKRLRGEAVIAATPIIFYTTTFRGPEARAMATLCGVHTVLPKPCPAKTLLAAVNKELGVPVPDSEEALPALEETWESASRLRLRFDWYRQELGELTVLAQKLFSQLSPGATGAQPMQAAQERFTNTFARLRQFSGGLTQLIETTLHAVPERGPPHIAESFFKTASGIIDCTYVVLSIVDTPAGTTRRTFASGLPAELYGSDAARTAPLLALLS
jgi:CheY-like chemotaxis protein